MGSHELKWSDFVTINLQDGTVEELPPITINIPAAHFVKMRFRAHKKETKRVTAIMMSQLRRTYDARIAASRNKDNS